MKYCSAIVAALLVLSSPYCAQASPEAIFQTFPSHAGFGQSGAWSSSQHPGTSVWSIGDNCPVRDSIALDDGSTVILGNCTMHRPDQAGPPAYFGPVITRIDATGQVLWAKRFNLQGLKLFENVKIGPNGTLLTWGMWPRCEGSNLCIRPILLTFDLNGNLKAAKSLQHQTVVKSEYLNAAAFTEQWELVGMSGSDIWKLDKNGKIEWVRDDRPAGESNTNLFLAVGNGTIFTVSRFVPNDVHYRRNIVIARDYSGKILWKRTLLAGPSDEIAAVTIDKNGMLILVGNTIRMGLHLEDKVHPRTGWIVKMTKTGAIRQSATVDPRYGYLLTGVSDSPRGLILRGVMPGYKRSLIFEDSSLKCLAYWPIPLNNMHFDLESSTSPIKILFEDVEVPILDFPLIAQRIPAKLEQPCEGTILPP